MKNLKHIVTHYNVLLVGGFHPPQNGNGKFMFTADVLGGVILWGMVSNKVGTIYVCKELSAGQTIGKAENQGMPAGGSI